VDAYIITQDDFKKLENEWGQLFKSSCLTTGK